MTIKNEEVARAAGLSKEEGQLAINGGSPVRTQPLPLEFPGIHYMDEEEIEAATRVLRDRSPFRYYGVKLRDEVDQFEKEFAAHVGLPYAVAVSSGTGALHTALSALGVGPGQEIIVPAYMWVAVVAAVVNLGAIPILADIDDTFGIDPEDLLRRVTPRTRGIIAVHMSGAPINVTPIAKIARERGLFLHPDNPFDEHIPRAVRSLRVNDREIRSDGGNGGKPFTGEGTFDKPDTRVDPHQVRTLIPPEDCAGQTCCTGRVGIGHRRVAVLLQLQWLRPPVLNRVAQSVQHPYARIAAPGEDKLARTSHANELVIE